MNNFKNGQNNLLTASVNDNCTCSLFGTTEGFYLYKNEPFNELLYRKIANGVHQTIQINNSNLFLIVPYQLEHRNELIIWDDNQSKIISKIIFKKNILNIYGNNTYIVVATKDKLYIYDFSSMEHLVSIEADNENGIFQLNDDYIYYPSQSPNNLNIFNIKTKEVVQTIECHQNPIHAFVISNDGTRLATTSKRGTIIRIFELNNCVEYKLLKEVRRGSDPADINHLHISFNNKYLSCCNVKGTLHVFNIDTEENNQNAKINVFYLNNLLPKYFSSEWSFSQFYMNNHKMISYFHPEKDNQLYIICDNGCFYVVDFMNECKVIFSTKFLQELRAELEI